MPPKKRTRLEPSDESSSEPIIFEKDQATAPASVIVNESSSESPDQDDVDSSLPMCAYGASCYRKNPDHFKTFRHPSGHPGNAVGGKRTDKQQQQPAASLASSVAAVSVTAAAPASGPGVGAASAASSSAYGSVLQLLLAKGRLSADDKRLAREFRKSHAVSDEEHRALLQRLGWSEDEYDDGEKKDDGTDLAEERAILQLDTGFKIIRITKEDAEQSKEKQAVFARVCHQFLSTMAKAQANFSISEIGVIVSTPLWRAYHQKKMQLETLYSQQHQPPSGPSPLETWGFHGTSADSILKIANSNFMLPDEIAALSSKNAGGKGGKGGKSAAAAKAAAKKFGIEVLDDGYFGKGVYFTAFSDYAAWYSAERSSDQVLLSKLLVGKQFSCNQRMDGKPLQPGYDSHRSPKGNEFVIFSKEQILPRYIITFQEKDAEEREQES
eukprot:TRINITY_DN836_c0_g2_i2.p1 TRINITY_DN836_c0_g2~~TRINITY_DN836_c0_g2_i2.p1  ORF type:complete len:440 (-),score=152.75 TRINITY_DN836_c0_g2_i2:1070-2389(-)